MKKELGKVKQTSRGFELIEFKCFGQDDIGSLQESSLATEPCIWLGTKDANPKIMASVARRLDVPTIETTGWIPYTKIPEEVMLSTRMHLDREQVMALIRHLQQWVRKGTFKL